MVTCSESIRALTRRQQSFCLLAASLVLSLIFVELGYRTVLFSEGDRFESLRDPALYADYLSEDLYWKLYFIFDGVFKPPRRAHPALGWVGNFSRTTFRHRDSPQLGRRRPVLLYGDSFAACTDSVPCFEDLLNADSQFNSENYLLNYGVGGYGLDQSFLLLQKSVDLFSDPFVVFSLLTYDLDRSILSVRLGQKPRFQVVDGALELEATLINEKAEAFFASHPPRVVSYLYRRAVFGDLLPSWLSLRLRRESHYRKQKLEVNEKILSAALAELRRPDLGFVFLVFHGDRPTDNPLSGGTDWREEFLRQWLEENHVPHIWSKDVAAADRNLDSASSALYIDPETLHPTEHFNRILALEIKSRVLFPP